MATRAYGTALIVPLLILLAACEPRNEAGKQAGTEETASETAAPSDGLVTLPAGSLRNVEIKTEVASIGTLNRKLKVPGRLAADANRTAKVSATLEGRVMRLNRDIGDKVARGEVMGSLETPELLDKPLLLRAPVAGVVIERSASVGELAEKGRALYEISDPSRLWLIGEVREKDLGLVRAGQKVDFRVASYPDTVFRGDIGRVGAAVEAESRTFEIRVEVDNRRGLLKPGMFADLEIVTAAVPNALLIGDAALQTEGEDQIAFVALDSNRFEKRVVKIGSEEDGRVQVLSGIKAGERIVTEGSFTLKSELLKGELGEE